MELGPLSKLDKKIITKPKKKKKEDYRIMSINYDDVTVIFSI